MFRSLMSPIAVVSAATFLLANPAAADRADAHPTFEDHRLIQVDLRTSRDLRMMLEIGATPWACRVGVGKQEFSVSPEQLAIVEAAQLEFDILAENVQRLFDEEAQQIAEARALAAGDDAWFAVYRTTAEVNAYIDDLVNLKPDVVEKLTVGTTIEGRTVHAMRITGPGEDAGERPAVLFNGAQHAREWISVMVPMYIADQLVKGYGVDPRVTAVLDSVVVYVVPIVNPDGYEFSQLPGNRMWRKNRRNNPGSSCFGVDLNRNWDYNWGGPHSTSTNPCSDIFFGSGAHSEPETANLAAFIEARPNIAAHIDIHSYSELVLHAWGDTTPPHPENDNIVALAAMMSQAIYDTHGVWYPYGTPGQLLYMVSGSMQDWTTATGAYGYTIEVRPSSPSPGFLLPPEQILPTSQENYAAALVMAEFVAQGVVYSFPDGLPSLVDANGNTNVTVKATPISSGDLNHASATLYTRVGSGGFQPTPMAYLGDMLYEATFPGTPCGVEVEYYFEVQSLAGNFYQAPLGAPSSVFTATSANIAEQELLAETFDAGLPNGWSATGLWNFTSSCPVTGACEPQWAYYGQSGPCNYDAGTNSGMLTSAPVSIPELSGGTATLSFCYNLQTENNTAYDIAEFSINNGPWTRMNEAATWTTHVVDVSSFAGSDVTLRWRFNTVDGVQNNYRGWQVTNVNISTTFAECPACPADLNGDGVVDVSDLLALLGDWGPCTAPCPADINADSVVDVSDLLLLLGAWGGCE